MKLEAVVFDLGGVVVDSPLHAIARYERDHGIEHDAINHAIVAVGEGGAWSRLERGELAMDAFFADFAADCRGEGIVVDARRMMEYIASGSGPRGVPPGRPPRPPRPAPCRSDFCRTVG